MTEYRTLEITVKEPRSSWPSRSYGELFKPDEKANYWLLGCPACGLIAFLNHEVTVTEGKATIDPSVICPECNAHYWVRDGKVQPC